MSARAHGQAHGVAHGLSPRQHWERTGRTPDAYVMRVNLTRVVGLHAPRDAKKYFLA